MKRSARRSLPILLLALSAPLVLSSSEAGPEQPAPGLEGAVCEAGPADPMAGIQQTLAQLAAPIEALPADGDVVVLNGSGYNYRPKRGTDLEQIERELLRLEQRGR